MIVVDYSLYLPTPCKEHPQYCQAFNHVCKTLTAHVCVVLLQHTPTWWPITHNRLRTEGAAACRAS